MKVKEIEPGIWMVGSTTMNQAGFDMFNQALKELMHRSSEKHGQDTNQESQDNPGSHSVEGESTV